MKRIKTVTLRAVVELIDDSIGRITPDSIRRRNHITKLQIYRKEIIDYLNDTRRISAKPPK